MTDINEWFKIIAYALNTLLFIGSCLVYEHEDISVKLFFDRLVEYKGYVMYYFFFGFIINASHSIKYKINNYILYQTQLDKIQAQEITQMILDNVGEAVITHSD